MIEDTRPNLRIRHNCMALSALSMALGFGKLLQRGSKNSLPGCYFKTKY